MRHDAVRLYRAGDVDVAWSVIRYLVRLGQDDGQLEAFAACVVTRIRENLARLIAMLGDAGYRFCENDDDLTPRGIEQVWRPPGASALEASRHLAAHYGDAGFLVHARIEHVGDVNINGDPHMGRSGGDRSAVGRAPGLRLPFLLRGRGHGE